MNPILAGLSQEPHDLSAFFLVGPTAAGKTAVSQWIAERHSCDILSADAMMVYRGMDIGTAKPDQVLRNKVRYWGLDLAAPSDAFSVGQYQRHALSAVGEALLAGRRIIVTGGTGLYIKSLTHGLNRLSAGNPDIRQKADELLQRSGIGALQEWARAQAPEQYESMADKQNPRRLVRVIETAHCSAGSKNDLWRLLGKGPVIAGLMMPKALLDARIKERVNEMYAGGLLAEVEGLLRQGFFTAGESAPTAGKAIGYAEAILVLRRKLTIDEAMEITVKRTRQLAKRQMTWFRHQANVEWAPVDSGMKTDQIARMVMELWERAGPTPIAG